MLPLQPELYDSEDNDVALPYRRRWTMGVERNTESHHSLIPIRDQIDYMTEEHFLWIPYDVILHTPPLCFKIDERVWTARVPLLFLEIGEYHVTDRVMRQFDQPQHIPQPPEWNPMHFQVDLRNRLTITHMIPMELPSRPADGRPRRDMEAIHLSYGSAIGDGYMSNMPSPATTQNVGEIFTQHTTCGDTINYLFGHTNEMFDVSTSGGSLETLLAYARLASSGVHLHSSSLPSSTRQARQTDQTGQGDILPIWVRPPIDTELQISCPIAFADMHGLRSQGDILRASIGGPFNTQIDGSSSVVSSPGEDEFITIDKHIIKPPKTKVPVMKAKNKTEGDPSN
ncbi:hypothetical protein P3S68_024446 [Capsicum galapagoense]